jgi:hypothetical protein
VQPVPGSPQLARTALLLAVAALAALAAVVAFSQTEPPAHALPAGKPAPYNGLIGGVQLQSARCEQWNAGSAAERAKVVGALSYAVGGSTPYGRGTTLATDQAYALLDRSCANPIAENWLLYHLYIRAAGFRSYVTPQT